MQYPIEVTLKIWTLAPKIAVTDAEGNLVFFVKRSDGTVVMRLEKRAWQCHAPTGGFGHSSAMPTNLCQIAGTAKIIYLEIIYPELVAQIASPRL